MPQSQLTLLNVSCHSLASLHKLSITSRRMRWAEHVARMGERRGAYGALVGKPDGRRPLGRPRSRWEDNIKMDLRETGWGDIDWVDVAQDTDRWRALVSSPLTGLRFNLSPPTRHNLSFLHPRTYCKCDGFFVSSCRTFCK
jgi:hypothetical protein